MQTPPNARKEPVPSTPEPGDLIAGRYRILRQLGAGGFGAVWHARQESMGRDVAVKTLLPQISNDPIAIERFRREAFHASSLRHPHTITLHDYGQSDEGLFYIVMELLEGESLARAIYRHGGLPLGRALRIGVQILQSLGEAHQRGLVHRDLKPENIFLVRGVVGQPDFVKVLDFGLSKALAMPGSSKPPEESLTQHGMVFGTPLYMAPEQAYGEEVKPASDVFAFGLLFYEMLVGRRPYEGLNQMDVMMKITQDPMPRLPAPLDRSPLQTYLDAVTEKEIVDRYKSAVEALPPLERLARGEGMAALGDLDRVYVGRGSPNFGKGKGGNADAQAATATTDPQHGAKPNRKPAPAPPQAPSPSATQDPRKARAAAAPSPSPKPPRNPPRPRSLRPNPIQYRQHGGAPTSPGTGGPNTRRTLSSRASGMIERKPRITSSRFGNTTTPNRDAPASKAPASRRSSAPVADADAGASSADASRSAGVFVDVNAKRSSSRHDSLFAHEPATVILDLNANPELAAKLQGPDPSEAALSTQVPMLGRDAQLAQLLGWGQRALQGQGGFVMVEGDAGIGKSRLIQHFSEQVVQANGVRLIQGAYVANGQGPGMGLRAALEDMLRIEGTTLREAEALVRERFAELDMRSDEFVDMILAVLRSRGSSSEGLAGASSTLGATTPAVYRMLEWLIIREASQQPLVMVLEDLHWADPFTLGFAEYLAFTAARRRQRAQAQGRDVSLPLVVICTARREDMRRNPELVRVFQNMGQHLGLGFGRIELGRLDMRVLLDLTQQLRPVDSSTAQAIVRLSGGNPLVVVEALRYAHICAQAHQPFVLPEPSAAGTGAMALLSELVHKRVKLMPMCHPEAAKMGELIRMLSVLGAWLAFDLMETFLVRLGRDDLVRVLPTLLNHLCAERLLKRTGERFRGTYAFDHATLQEVLFERLRMDARWVQLHEAAARAKETLSYEDSAALAPWLGGIAQHWREVGDRARVLEFSLRDARAAEASWDFKSARALYRRVELALEREGVANVMRIEIQYALGSLHARLGELEAGEELLRKAAELSKTLREARWEGRAQVVLGKLLTWQSRHREALRCFRRAMSCFASLKNADQDDLAGLADAQFGQGEVARVRGDLGPAETTLKKALQQARKASAPVVEAHCLQGLGRIAHVGGRLKDALSYFQGAVEQFGRSGLMIEEAYARSDQALSELYVHGRHQALATNERALKALMVGGERLRVAHGQMHKALILRRGMDMPQATSIARRALDTFRDLKHDYGIAKCLLLMGELSFMQGNLDAAEERAQEALRIHEAIGDAHGTVLCLIALGCWALEQGRFEEAAAQLVHALDIVKGSNLLFYKAACHAHLGRIEEHQGNLGAAQRLYADAYNEALRSSNQETVALAAVLLGGLGFIQGRMAEARGYLETGLGVANDLDVSEHRALALFSLAWMETLTGQHHARKTLLDQLTPMVKPLGTPDFYLREHVARVARTVTIVRGVSEAERYRRAALDVIHGLR